jgi:hypothetical protein
MDVKSNFGFHAPRCSLVSLFVFHKPLLFESDVRCSDRLLKLASFLHLSLTLTFPAISRHRPPALHLDPSRVIQPGQERPVPVRILFTDFHSNFSKEMI